MDSIVNHKGVWCKVVRHGWKVKTFRAKRTGQTETIVYPRKLYIPLDDIDNPDLLVKEVDQTGTVFDEECKARAALAAKARERSRAKTMCRHRIKSYDLRQLLTGTYKENMQDYDRARRDFKAYVRLMSKYIKNFLYVVAFERQDRGAWHWHAAVRKMPPFILVNGYMVRSFRFARQMWLRVVGEYEGKPNGTVNIDGHNRAKAGNVNRWTQEQSLACIAGYVSKYLTEDHGEGLAGRNMWNSAKGMIEDVPTITEISENVPLYHVIDLCLVGGIPEGHRIAKHRLGRFGDFWLLYTEPIPI